MADLENLSEEEKEKRIENLYEAIEIKYEDFHALFKQVCEAYATEDIFTYLCTDLYGEENPAEDWENIQIYGEMLEENEGEFEDLGEEFAQFVYDTLCAGKAEVTAVCRPSLVHD